MALLKSIDKCATCERSLSPNVLQYANDKRNNGSFNDVTIEAGDQKIAANRLILSCCSPFFEAMFDLEMKEKYQNPVQIHGVDGAAVKSVIDFMYSGEVKITSGNVMELIAASDYLQVDEVKRFCFEFLESILSSDNWFAVFSAAKLYESEQLQNKVYEYVSNNFDDVIETYEFKAFARKDLVSFISNANRKQIKEEFIFNGLVTWVRHDEEARKNDFPTLFEKLISLDLISDNCLKTIVLKEKLIRKSIYCLELVTSHLCQKRKSWGETKIISLGGTKSLRSCIEVYSCSTSPQKIIPNLPIELNSHCSLRLGDYVYLIGGERRFDDDKNVEILDTVWQLNIKAKEPKWHKMNSLNNKRCFFGGTVFRDTLVVAGGYDGNSFSKSVEIYLAAMDEWKASSPLPKRTCAFALVAIDDYLYALGGLNECSASVQRISNLQRNWEEIASMQIPRKWFAAVICNKTIFAIGGQTDSKQNKLTNTVEQFDFVDEKWIFVNCMNTKRYGHAACVMNGKIYVVGGLDPSNQVIKSIECYDPETDSWNVVGNTDAELYNHSLIVL